ncbi:glycosyltransferase [Micromonospora sp. NPDC049679]|uniref:glycosyltransferase n=1 Tax=Micromonospora sp. NPDC049679 TaxID=3155920 RepID=UPI0033EC1731
MRSLLTVVVPIYNVERYLAECLASLAGQTYRDLDIVLVDDGSTDASAAVAQEWTAQDPRFRLLRQANQGLGAARNAGIRTATGDYLAFVDSDDVLPPYAFEVLVGALERSGSDFASGNVALWTSRGLRQSPLHRGTHRHTRLGVRLSDQRNLVYDRLACNKVFRRSFWEKHGLRFPEGVRYEDIPVTIPAYALAGAVDVIDLPVYYWRQREAGSEQSISQRQMEISNLVDRFAAVDSASRALAGLGDVAMKNWYDETALQSDLRMFLDLLPDVDVAYRDRFLELAGDFLSRVDDHQVINRLVPRLRVAWRLARLRQMPDLLAVVAASRGGATPPVLRGRRGTYLRLPLLDADHPELPRALYRIPGGLRTQVHDLQWRGGGLRLRGSAYDAAKGARRPWSSPRLLWLREISGRRRGVLLPTFSRRTNQVPSSVPYGWSGFSVVVDPRRLRRRNEWVEGEWAFNVAVLGSGRRLLGIGDGLPTLPARWVDEGVRIVPEVRNRQLRLRVERPRVWVTSLRFADGDLIVEGGAAQRPVAAALSLCAVRGVTWRSYPVRPVPDGTAWSARIPLDDLVDGSGLPGRRIIPGEAGQGWRVCYRDGEDEPLDLPFAPGCPDVRETVRDVELIAQCSDDDTFCLRALPPGPLASQAALARDGSLSLSGELPAGWHADGADLALVLRAGQPADPAIEPEPDRVVPIRTTADGQWSVRVELDGASALAAGDWQLLYRSAAEADLVDLRCRTAARRALPSDVSRRGRRLQLAAADWGRLLLRVGSGRN